MFKDKNSKDNESRQKSRDLNHPNHHSDSEDDDLRFTNQDNITKKLKNEIESPSGNLLVILQQKMAIEEVVNDPKNVKKKQDKSQDINVQKQDKILHDIMKEVTDDYISIYGFSPSKDIIRSMIIEKLVYLGFAGQELLDDDNKNTTGISESNGTNRTEFQENIDVDIYSEIEFLLANIDVDPETPSYIN